MRRKAQVGSAITWLVAFLIIFFIIFLFVGFSIGLAGKKTLKGEKSKIGILEDKGSLFAVEQLVSILNTRVDYKNNKVTIDNLLQNFQTSLNEQEQNKMKEAFEKEIKNILDKTRTSTSPYYIFQIEYLKSIPDRKGSLGIITIANTKKILENWYKYMKIFYTKEQYNELEFAVESNKENLCGRGIFLNPQIKARLCLLKEKIEF